MHPTLWHTPRPLWQSTLDAGDLARFHRPAILRFDRDTFMEDLQRDLDTGTPGFDDLLARPETWRTASSFATLPLPGPLQAVKLYQPAHQRFYLVAASLICRVRSLPDRRVDAAAEEAVGFVIRRVPVEADGTLRPPTHPDYHELGWFGDKGWKRMDDPGRPDNRVPVAGAAGGDGAAVTFVTEREERLPLFPLNFKPPGLPFARRLHAGLIPVARRETYEAAPQASPALSPEQRADPLGDARATLFDATVVQALDLLRVAINDMNDATKPDAADVEPGAARDVLVFALLDLAEFLEAHLPQVWASIWDEAADAPASPVAWTGTDAAQQAVFERLHVNSTPLPGGDTWAEAAAAVYAARDTVVGGDLDDVRTLSVGQLAGLAASIASLGSLSTLVRTALAGTESPAPGVLPGTPPAVDARAGAVYVIRFVYERPRCQRPDHKATVSAPSQPFQMASFFDTDAPARPIRITLPVDTSVRGFRQAAKGVSMVFSEQLRNQVERVQNAKFEDLDKQEIDDGGGWGLGMICSFSIPIITICAIILLMIIVQLLNIVFWWLPFFRICFPIPVKTD